MLRCKNLPLELDSKPPSHENPEWERIWSANSPVARTSPGAIVLNPGTKLGPFIIEAEIGSGAMGAVYKAQYRDQSLRVAVKIMAPGIGSGETAEARFQREADILKELKHPNIVRLLASGHFKSSPFYAMEFIQGETLESVLERRKRLPWEEVVR